MQYKQSPAIQHPSMIQNRNIPRIHVIQKKQAGVKEKVVWCLTYISFDIDTCLQNYTIPGDFLPSFSSLLPPHGIVRTFFLKQFIMASNLCYFSFFQYINHICVDNG